ncbi:conserved domain protein [Mucinivorans hirudinis]|uniref:Conserved domain protein n=1 Tax=Mucinivorans hirudinis TaxID=1433126 RepID=A0A060RDY8_9BACT|nr:conserved domain protein [Mucinivorans hirudinis]
MNSQYLDSLNAPLQLQPNITLRNVERIIKRLIENGKQVKTTTVNQNLVYHQWVTSVDEQLQQLFVNNSSYNTMFLRFHSLLKPCIQQPKSFLDNSPYANPYGVKLSSTTPQNQFITIDNCIDDAIEAIEEMALGIGIDLNPKVTAVEDKKPQQAQSVKSDNPKIFISHSSDDEKIVKSFVTQILRLGCGLQPKDIICTSLESMGVKTGEDIRNCLKNNLKDCEYVFFMISDNYQKSGICLNEMGAAWVLDKKVKPFLFPNLNFTDLGWLYEISKGSTLDNESALDHLRDELLEAYALIKKPQTADWNIQKNEFLTQLKG